MWEEVVVWNLDARYRPELEVELEVTYATMPARGLAHGTPALGTATLLKDVDIPFANLDDLMNDDGADDDGVVVHAAH